MGYSSVIPFLHRMSAAEKEEFTEEFIDVALDVLREKNMLKDDGLHNGVGVCVPMTLLTAFVEKN